MAVDNRQIDAIRLVAPKLELQAVLRIGPRREHHQPRGIAIDSMDDERFSLATRSQVDDEQILDARLVAAARERHRQQAGGFVDDDKRLVFVDNLEPPMHRGRASPAAPRTAGSIHPDANSIARLQAAAGLSRRHLDVVDEDFPPLEHGRRAAPGAELRRPGKEPVEPPAGRLRVDDEPEVALGRYT